MKKNELMLIPNERIISGILLIRGKKSNDRQGPC